jgi:hypothetical protein
VKNGNRRRRAIYPPNILKDGSQKWTEESRKQLEVWSLEFEDDDSL